ncbi:hypothetical protein Gogos_012370 [Gossypium gossypioides]|uniref:RNase H type-1 domain-containing protein n=1 Tax=Gossypium gossypioides TaxID=34282 RepID=A0A7J9BS98_GOSGO|nr:hypothetical protein [Gossypium gossypioides]
MLEGLKLAWSWSFQKVEIKSDNALLIDTLRNGLVAVNNIVEVRTIHEWFYKGWEVKCRLIVRDSNKVVDCLDNEARGRMNQLVVLNDPPQNVRHILEEDIQHVLHSKAAYVEA